MPLTMPLKSLTAAVLLASVPSAGGEMTSTSLPPLLPASEPVPTSLASSPSKTQKPLTLARNDVATATDMSALRQSSEQLSNEKDDSFIKVAGIPKGFESFHEPQLTAVDVYYGGRLVTTAIAEYTPDTLRFLKPEQVAGAIKGLKDPDAVTEQLRGELPSNASRICELPRQPLCGNLNPDAVGLIFDENRFRATIFVNPNLLLDAAQQDPRYLPPPDKDRVTVVQNLNALTTGNNQGQDQFSVFGVTRAGYNGHYGFSDWVSTDQQGLSFDQLGYRHVLKNHEVTAGLFEPTTDALRGLRRDLLMGGSVATSVNLRQDLASVIASPIELFLPIRGRVDIFRDGRLINSGFYEAGNQFIDSARLPNGAYLIDIVITDDAGNTRTEQQLFVKSTLLPPPGEPQWFVEAGRVKARTSDSVLPDSIDATLLRSGYRWRQQDWLGFGVASAITDQQLVGELSSNVYTDWSELGAEVYASDQGGWGWGARGSARWQNTNFSLSSQRNFSDDEDFIADTDYALIDQSRWLYSAQVSRPVLRNGLASASHSHSGSENGGRSRRNALSYSYNQFLGNGKGVTYRGEISEVDGDKRIQLSVQFRATSRHWNHSAQLDWVDSESTETQGATASVATRWRDQDKFVDDIQLGANARVDQDTNSVNIDGQHRSQYGVGRAEVSVAKTDTVDTRQYLVGYDTSIVLDEQSRIAVGSPLTGESAVVVDLAGAEGAVVDILSDGQRQFSARGGSRVPVTLTPYQQYQISIADRGTQMLKYNNDSVDATLYVGDVDSLNFEASRINVLVSRLYSVESVCSEVTDECYQIPLPMRSVAISGAAGILFSDSEGYFQGELSTATTRLVSEINGEPCYIDLSGLQAENGVLRASRLYCSTEQQLKKNEAEAEENSAADSGNDEQAPKSKAEGNIDPEQKNKEPE